ncbi:MAG TPA: hypothetical protein VLA24_09750 [Pseudomonadales bacterium]|nr:hypothetical protein [Pseudomonadales bacterium]
MRLVSFDAFRTCRLPNAHYIKPDHSSRSLELIKAADWCLFPEYWQVNTLVFGLNKRIFPSLPSYLLGHNKIEFSRVMTTLWPQHIPQTFILDNSPQAREDILAVMDFPFVCKTPKSSEGRGVFLIENRADFMRYCDTHPVLYVQEYLPIDRDCRIVVIGEAVVASYWRVAGEGNFHNNIAQGGSLCFDPVPQRAIDLVLEVAKTLGIDHAGFDVAMVGGHPYIFEFNRLFGNHGLTVQGIDPSSNILQWLEANSLPDQTPPKTPEMATGKRRKMRPLRAA